MNQEEFKITNTTELKDGEIIKSGDIWAAYKGQSPKDPEQMLVHFSINIATGTLRKEEHEVPKCLGWGRTSLLMRCESFLPALDRHGYVWNNVMRKLIAFHG